MSKNTDFVANRNITRRDFVSGAFALSAALTIAGCSTTQPGQEASTEGGSEGKAMKPEDMKIEFITINPSEVTSMQVDAMTAYAEKLGVNDFTCEYFNTEVATEQSLIENAVQSGVSALIIFNQGADDCVDTINEAVDAGVVVLLYMTDVPDANYTLLYAEDGEKVGNLEAEIAADWAQTNLVDKGIDVVYAAGTYSISTPAVDRFTGATEKFAELMPDATYVGSFEAAYKEEGLEGGENLLQSHPDVNLVLAVNDQSGLGVMEAYQAAGKTADDVAIFGMDGTPDGLRAIAEGTMFKGAVMIPTNEVGEKLVQAAVDVLSGDSEYEIAGKSVEYMEDIKVTEDNVDDYKDIWDNGETSSN
jgi:ribose transport system substrate-binding protein